MSERWFRWYDGTMRDGKMILVAHECDEAVATIIGIWASLLEDAATSEPRGVATRGIEHHSRWLGIADQIIRTAWNALERLGAVRIDGERIVILNWSKRQFETDAKDPTAKERKEKWKNKNKALDGAERSGTGRNGLERSGTPETKTETETEEEGVAANAAPSTARETPSSSPPQVAPAPSPRAYAFESGIIRLNEKDFEQWKTAFANIDVAAELIGLAPWAERQGKSWFNACSGALAKRNREARAAKEARSKQPVKTWID